MQRKLFMRRAIELSAQALHTPGTEPFAAVVVMNGKIVGEGINRSKANLDPTSHGETEAIRDACRTLGSVDLRGCELYTSCEPCTLCVAAMQIAGISRLYYAADLTTANAAVQGLQDPARIPVDSRQLQAECSRSVDERSTPAEQLLAEDAVAVIHDWATKVQSSRRS